MKRPSPSTSPRAGLAASLLRDRIQRVFRELPGVMKGDEEAVHQVRVSGRRLRVALRLLARKPDGKRVKRARKLVQKLTRTVGAGRDLDVLVGLLADRVGSLPAATREQQALLRRLRAARAKARAAVATQVRELDLAGLRSDLRELSKRGPADVATVLERAAEVRQRDGAALLQGFAEVGARYLPVELHALRRQGRRLRYVAEVEDQLRGQPSRAGELWKRLQESIGVLHDHHVLDLWLMEQEVAARRRGAKAVVRAVSGERRFFREEGRRLHAELLALKPAELADHALQTMGAGKDPSAEPHSRQQTTPA